MNKIIDFFKKKYKVLIPIMVVFVLLITVYFLYREYKYDNYRNKQDVSVYQYFNGVVVDYTAQVTYNLKDIIVGVTPIDAKIEYNSTPIYYSEGNKVIFPQDMSIIFPLKDGSQFKLYKYALYDNEDGNHIIKNSTHVDTYSNFFMFDGNELFFFPDEVTLYINDKEYAKLGGMSFIKNVGGYTLEYYDKTNDKSEFLEVEGKKITVKNENINVDITDKSLNNYGRKVLLFSPQSLKSLNN